MLQPLVGGLTPLGVGRLAGDYSSKVLATAPSHLLAYWKLDELSGTTAYDSSGNGYDGSYEGPTLNATSLPDGSPAPSFDGIDDFVNVYSAGFASAFNGSVGTVLLWVKAAAVSLWTDGSRHTLIRFRADNNNLVYIVKSAINYFQAEIHSGGVTQYAGSDPPNTTDWLPCVFTWSEAADELQFYVAGVPVGSAVSGLGTWVGALNAASTVIGAVTTSGTDPWAGSIARVAYWDTVLSAAEIMDLATD